MQIKLLRDWTGPVNGSGVRDCKAGETVSVLFWPGARLIRAHGALWIQKDPGDPDWGAADGLPPEVFRMKAVIPHTDKMLHKAQVNK